MTLLDEIMEKQHRLLSSKLLQKQRLVEIILHRSVLVWREIDTSRKQGTSNIPVRSHAVQVCEIVAVRVTEDSPGNPAAHTRRGDKSDQPSTQYYPHAFTVTYVRRSGQNRWCCRDTSFCCASEALRQLWVRAIDEQLLLLSCRPKSLLVYINPYGGKQRGKQIYEQKVAPLFRLASISTDVIVTERANHARDHLRTEANLEKYDGVVCVGGDGMFSEVLHGLVTRTQTDHGVDQNYPNTQLVPCGLRIGIIPAGSTDCICYATVGTNDPVTSALHIIVGDSQPMDVCSVHHNNTFLRYSVSLLGYGFYGDVLTDSEKKRWLGPARYDLSGAKIFLSHQYYEGVISFLPAEGTIGNPRDKLQCRSGCRVCQHKPQTGDKSCKMAEEKDSADKEGDGVWHSVRGKFIAINAATMSCACPRSPQGLSPAAHLADGTADLILVRKCSRLDFLRHLLRHTNKDDQFDHPFVEVHRVRRFRFQPEAGSLEDLSETNKKFRPICSAPSASGLSSTNSSWNCDGEIITHAAIQVSVQWQLVRLFARGIEQKQQTQHVLLEQSSQMPPSPTSPKQWKVAWTETSL